MTYPHQCTITAPGAPTGSADDYGRKTSGVDGLLYEGACDVQETRWRQKRLPGGDAKKDADAEVFLPFLPEGLTLDSEATITSGCLVRKGRVAGIDYLNESLMIRWQ